MSHPWMVEILRPFDGAQGGLQSKKESVMPAPDQSRGQAPAGIQVFSRRGGPTCPPSPWIPAFAGKTEGEVNFQLILLEFLGFEPKDI